MWNKIYLILLVVSIVVMGAVAYLAYSQLQSIGFAPAQIVASFNTYSSAYWGFLGVSFAVLLTVGNIILWKLRTAWALWTSLAFFAVFVLIKSFWLGKELLDYETRSAVPHSSPIISYFAGVLLCAAAAATVYFNHFLVLRMRDKIYGEPASIDTQVSPNSNEKSESSASIGTSSTVEQQANNNKVN
ncbi:MAG TPA: hypothetical protein VF692_06270 [Pyrinomonadaceae bacterium]|jgi:hypothetical protein